jgi:hypothetical protein
MKSFFYLILLFSTFIISHGAEKKDLLGSWKLVESSWNGDFGDIRSPTPIKIYSEGYVDGNYQGTFL